MSGGPAGCARAKRLGHHPIFAFLGSTACIRCCLSHACLKRDLGSGECQRDRAGSLRPLRERDELPLADTRNIANRVEHDPRDPEALVLLLEADSRRRTQLARWRARLAQKVGERHREAAGLGGGDQLLGIGCVLDALNARPQRERPLVGAAVKRDTASPVRDRALPGSFGTAAYAHAQEDTPTPRDPGPVDAGPTILGPGSDFVVLIKSSRSGPRKARRLDFVSPLPAM